MKDVEKKKKKVESEKFQLDVSKRRKKRIIHYLSCLSLSKQYKSPCFLAMSTQTTREAAKQIVKTLEKFPKERIKHLVSFKESQLDRYRPVAGLESNSKDSTKRPSLEDIRDIINRTSGPLGLKKDLLKKVQNALPQEHLTADSIHEQIKSLDNIMSNKYKNYYDVGDKLYRPNGNPQYYQRLMDEIEGKKKETIFTAFRTVVFGK